MAPDSAPTPASSANSAPASDGGSTEPGPSTASPNTLVSGERPATSGGDGAHGDAPGEHTAATPDGTEAHGDAPAADDASTATSNGDDEGDDGDAQADDGVGGDAAGVDAAGGDAAGGDAAGGEKKKRRRRKRRKAGAAGEGPPGDASPDVAAVQDARPTPRNSGGAPRNPGGAARGRPQHARPATERAPFHVGEEVFGKVTAVLETAVMIDLAGKALAIFDRGEMEADDLVPSPGDRFVARVHNDGVRGGLVVLTRKPLREEENKPKLEKAFEDGSVVHGLVTGVIRGGVEVDLDGLRAFAPASGMDLHPGNANFAALLGQRLDFRVVEFKGGGRDVVVSRRPMLEAEAHERRKHALALLEEGAVMTGVVRTVVEWGAFVALPAAEYLEGLVHATEASHDSRANLTELLHPGESIEVKILKIDERGKIWLSRKALIEDPWAAAKSKFSPGSRHHGKVTRTEPFGAFVELEGGLEGLIHIADLSLSRVEHANEVVKDGAEIDVVVDTFDARTKRLSLHPAPPPGRAEEQPQRVVKYAPVKVEVVKGEASGVVVRLLGVTGRRARGFIPAGQTGTVRGTDLRKAFKPGTVLEVKVIDIDERRGEPKLSIKGLHEDEEKRAHKEYRVKLKAEGGFGTLGDLLAKKLRGE